MKCEFMISINKLNLKSSKEFEEAGSRHYTQLCVWGVKATKSLKHETTEREDEKRPEGVSFISHQPTAS